MKRAIQTAVILLLALILPVFSVVGAGFLLPQQFDDTYYGELGSLYKRLYDIRGKKIVLIGNSSNAFGIRPDLIESELPGYRVVNFALYGAVGTKAMMDLSRGALHAGDVVVISPEQFDQSLSLYFSGSDTWRAVDGNFGMLPSFPAEDARILLGSFPGFVQEKYGYYSTGEKPAPDGVYGKASFVRDGFEPGYMVYERPCNVMAGGYDPNQMIDFDPCMIGEGFIDFLNEYIGYARSRDAEVFFTFSPMNRLALAPQVDDERIETYYDYLARRLCCRIIGDPHAYILDHEWFYDSNCHMNSAGMLVHTRQMLEDIKSALGITTITHIEIPPKPEIPVPMAEADPAEDSGADLFTYVFTAEGAMITGLSPKGENLIQLAVPSVLEGKPVFCISAEAFAGNSTVQSVTIPGSIRILYDGSFEGCTHLTSLILRHTSPSEVGVGTALLRGAPSCSVFVPKDALNAFRVHYNWSAYTDLLRGY